MTVIFKMNSTGSDMFYPEFKSLGVSPFFVAINSVKAIIAFAGILLNLALVLATVCSKSLHGSCNLLLAMDSFCMLVYCFSPFIPLALTLSGQNFVPLSTCFRLQLLPILGVNISFQLMLFIALERLVSISFPVWFNRRNPRYYLAGMAAIMLVLCVHNLYALYGEQSADIMVMCTLPDCYRGEIGQQLYWSGLLSIFITLGAYFFIWFQMHRSLAAKKVNSATRRLFKSLLMIICLVFFGWTVDICVRLLLPLLHLSPTTLLALSNLLSNCSFIAAGASVVVLYAFSKDYRAAFNSQLNRLFRCCGLLRWQLNSAMDLPTAILPTQPPSNGAVAAAARAAGRSIPQQQHRSASIAAVMVAPAPMLASGGFVAGGGEKKVRSISLREGKLTMLD